MWVKVLKRVTVKELDILTLNREDIDCKSACQREYVTEFEKCPCQRGCPAGCPCPDFECPSWTERTTVLALHWYLADGGATLIEAKFANKVYQILVHISTLALFR